jgi:hypothetical protein
MKKAAGEVTPPSNALTGPAKPRRSVCAPAAMAFSFYRGPSLERRSIMWFSSWLRRWTPNPRPPARFRPRLESLEDRALPSTFTAAGVNDLIAAIRTANRVGGTNTIVLAPNTTFDLTKVDNTTNGANGLPVIGGGVKGNLTILTLVGNGDAIEPSNVPGTPAFRLFDVAAGSSLTLENVTLQYGQAQGVGSAADGGAIYNEGDLILIGVTVQHNNARGSNGADGVVASKLKDHQTIDVLNGQPGGDAAGGGIWSSGTVTLQGGTTLYENQAFGGFGGAAGWLSDGTTGNGGAGGNAFGGGLYVAGGSVRGTDATLARNGAQGGVGGDNDPLVIPLPGPAAGNGGIGSGGGLYVAGGTVGLSNVGVETNMALGGGGGSGGYGELAGRGGDASGGGISVAGGTVYLLSLVDVSSNFAWGGKGGAATPGGVNHSGGQGGNGFGGGLYVGGGAVSLANVTMTDNWASGGEYGPLGSEPIVGPPPSGVGEGGGIYNAGTLTLSGCTLSGNVAYDDFIYEFSPFDPMGDGGGLYNAASGTLDVTNGSTVTGNHAAAGADLYNLGAADISSDSTVGVIGP